MSSITQGPADNFIFHQIIAPVTAEEIAFMQQFGIENGDGIVDSKEFIILAVVRTGTISPGLVTQIKERFRQLDRKHTGRIQYHDIIVGKCAPPIIPLPAALYVNEVPKHLTGRRFSASTVTTCSRQRALSAARAKSTIMLESDHEKLAADLAAFVEMNKKGRKTSKLLFQAPSNSQRETIREVESFLSNSSDGEDCDGDGARQSSRRRIFTNVVDGLEKTSEEGAEDICDDGSNDCDDVEEDNAIDSGDHLDEVSEDEDIVDADDFTAGPRGEMTTDVHAAHHTNSLDLSTETIESNGEDCDVGSTGRFSLDMQSRAESSLDDIDDDSSGRFSDINSFRSTTSSNNSGRISRGMKRAVSNTMLRMASSNSARSCQQGSPSSISPSRASSNISSGRIIPIDDDLVHTRHSPSSERVMMDRRGKDNVDSPSNTFRSAMDDDVSYRIQSLVNENGLRSTSTRHHEKLQQARNEEIRLHKEARSNRKKQKWQLRLLKTKRVLTSPYAIAFYLWCLWLAVGAMYYTFEENLPLYKGIFVSTSIGYGIFWFELTSTSTHSALFMRVHYMIGVFAVALAMAIFAGGLNMDKRRWYEQALQRHLVDIAKSTDGYWDDCVAYFDYYWPKIRIHVLFLVGIVVGIAWGVWSLQLTFLDAMLLALTTMTRGGLVHLPSTGVQPWDYIFCSLYIIVGAPAMAISCGIIANHISLQARHVQHGRKLNASMTEDELLMMKHLGVEDDDGYIDAAEFTILLLVRIGALNPDLIAVLLDRFWDLDTSGTGAVTYADLQNRKSFVGSSRELFSSSSPRDDVKEFSTDELGNESE